MEVALPHQLSDDVDGLAHGADGQELDQPRVLQAFQVLDLFHKVISHVRCLEKERGKGEEGRSARVKWLE